MADTPALKDGDQHLARIQQLWTELQAARKDHAKYQALMERIRREADAFLRTLRAHDPKP